jgi:anti-anti-sigma factor
MVPNPMYMVRSLGRGCAFRVEAAARRASGLRSQRTVGRRYPDALRRHVERGLGHWQSPGSERIHLLRYQGPEQRSREGADGTSRVPHGAGTRPCCNDRTPLPELPCTHASDRVYRRGATRDHASEPRSPASSPSSQGRQDMLGMCMATGEIDMATAPSLSADLHDAIDDSSHALVTVDCSGITFMGSSGYRVLLEATEYATRQGRTLVIRDMSSSCARLILLCDENNNLTFEPPREPRHGGCS